MKRFIAFTITSCLFLSAQFANCQSTKAIIKTDYGNMTVELYDDTPQHRDNFIKLANEGFFNDLLFHRVISGFMIQGGDPDSRNADSGAMLGQGGPGYQIPAEILPHYYHKKGALAAARTSDQVNPQRMSSGSQFYIVQGKPQTAQNLNSIVQRKNMGNPQGDFYYSEQAVADYGNYGGTPHLDGEYTVFGQVIEGLGVIDQIARLAVDRNSRPMLDVKMTIEIVK